MHTHIDTHMHIHTEVAGQTQSLASEKAVGSRLKVSKQATSSVSRQRKWGGVRKEGQGRPGLGGGRRKQRNAGSVSGLVSDTENKCKFFDAKRKPVERSKRPISPSEFDYIFICAFLKRGSEEEEGDWRI